EPRRRQAAGDRRRAVGDRAGGGQAERGAPRPVEADPGADEGSPRLRGGPHRRRARRAQPTGGTVNDNDQPVLICYDGSEEAKRAIPAAAALLGERRAVVLDVGPPVTPEQTYAETFAPVVADFREENDAVALRRAQAGLEQVRLAGFHAVARSEVAAPTWQGIVHAAEVVDAAVIVVGSHARDAAGEFFHGSVSHDVATHTGRPVLIVPPPRR